MRQTAQIFFWVTAKLVKAFLPVKIIKITATKLFFDQKSSVKCRNKLFNLKAIKQRSQIETEIVFYKKKN